MSLQVHSLDEFPDMFQGLMQMLFSIRCLIAIATCLSRSRHYWMKIATWNVNSIRTRLEHVTSWLQTHSVDVLCLQETKVVDDSFPQQPFTDLGYHAYVSGQKSYNGVAFLSRTPLSDVSTGFASVLGERTIELDEQKRVITGVLDGIRIINLYVPNGSAIGSDKYLYKLRWLETLREYLQTLGAKGRRQASKSISRREDGEAEGRRQKAEGRRQEDEETRLLTTNNRPLSTASTQNSPHPPLSPLPSLLSPLSSLLICGDFNIALEDIDIHDPAGREKMVMATEPERQALRAVLELGLADAFRKFTTEGGNFSWWDYRAAAFPRNRGWRIDHIYLTPDLYTRAIACTIDATPRAFEQPSDHVPVIVEL